MDIPIEHEAFSGRSLTVRTGGFFKGPRLLIDGEEVKGKGMYIRRRFLVKDNAGKEVTVHLKSSGMDLIPKVEVDGRAIELARPLTWYELTWIILPVVLVIGGGFGGLVGVVAAFSNAHIFRSERSTAAKYTLSGLITVGAVVVWLILVALIASI